MFFTVEEENLLCIFDTSSRAAAIAEICGVLPDFDEPELREIAGDVLRKLEAMSGVEFAALDFSPEYFSDDEEE